MPEAEFQPPTVIAGFFFLLLAAAVAGVSWWMLRRQGRMERDGVRAQGVVVGTTTHNVRLPDGGSTTQAMLVLEWTLPGGQPFRAPAAGDPKRHPVGQPVGLRDLPDAPQRIEIEGERPGKGGVIGLGVLAAFLFLMGVATFFRR